MSSLPACLRRFVPALLGLSLPALAAGNLVANGSFEEAPAGQAVAPHWFVHQDVLAAAREPRLALQRSAGDAADGSSWLQLSKRGGGTLAATHVVSATAYERLMETPDRRLVLQGWLRGRGLDHRGARLSVQVFARTPGEEKRAFAGRLVSREITGDTGWTPVEVSFRLGDILPVGTTLAYLEINAELPSDTGSADFDHISLSHSAE